MEKYDEVIEQLYQQFPMFQKYGSSAYHPGLDRIREMATRFSNPEQDFPTIHIAGTNGKGSTAHIVAAALQESGKKVGLYSSPHLIDFRERIKINGAYISKRQVTDYYHDIQRQIEDLQPSFFEVTTLMSFLHFRDQKVDVAVIETGLGGRLDATNILTPIISVITSISKEHEAFLGNTLKKIAGEKAGIIKIETPAVISHQNKKLAEVFEAKATTVAAPVHWSIEKNNWESDLQASYQQHNISVAFKVINEIQEHFKISESQFNSALKRVRDTTKFTGRFMLLQKDPVVIADAGHNVEGLKATWNSFYSVYKAKKIFIIISCSNDKNISAFLEHLPENVHLIITSYNQSRAMKVDDLKAQVPTKIKSINLISDPKTAVKQTLAACSANDALLITGSVFLIGEIFLLFSKK